MRAATGDVGTSNRETGNGNPEPGSDLGDEGIARHETMFDVLSCVQTERKQMRKRKFSLMLAAYSLIFFAYSLIFFAYSLIVFAVASAFAWCE